MSNIRTTNNDTVGKTWGERREKMKFERMSSEPSLVGKCKLDSSKETDDNEIEFAPNVSVKKEARGASPTKACEKFRQDFENGLASHATNSTARSDSVMKPSDKALLNFLDKVIETPSKGLERPKGKPIRETERLHA